MTNKQVFMGVAAILLLLLVWSSPKDEGEARADSPSAAAPATVSRRAGRPTTRPALEERIKSLEKKLAEADKERSQMKKSLAVLQPLIQLAENQQEIKRLEKQLQEKKKKVVELKKQVVQRFGLRLK